jgi:hypothetical protein
MSPEGKDIMIDMKVCFNKAYRLYIPQGRVLDPKWFAKKFGNQIDGAGRWFISNGLAQRDKKYSIGWSPRLKLYGIFAQLRRRKTLSKKLTSKKLLDVLATKEAAQHFTTLVGCMCYIWFWTDVSKLSKRYPKHRAGAKRPKKGQRTVH